MSEKDNIKGLLSNSKSRLNIFLIAGIILICFIAGTFFVKKSKAPPAETAPVVNNTGVNATVAAAPGQSQNRIYNEKQEQENLKESEAADKKGQSYLPTLVNNNLKSDDVNNAPAIKTTEPPRVQPLDNTGPTVLNSTPNSLNNSQPQVVKERKTDPNLLRKQEEEQIAAQEALARKQELQQEVAERKKAYLKQLSNYVGEWTPNPQFVETPYKSIPLAAIKETTPTSGSSSGASNSSAAEQQKQVIATAGSFIPSVLVSGINTDYQGPVVAKIVSGTLKDAIVTGGIVVGPDGAMLKFTKIAFSDGTSAKLNGYAVSSDAYSYKMATDVDNHYLANYSKLFAGAFLQGYGAAEQTVGESTTVDPTTGTVTQSTDQLSTSQVTQKAAGNVAQTVGGALIAKSQRPPTITVDVGTPFALLLVDNLAI